MLKVKLVVCFIWLTVIAGFFSIPKYSLVNAQSKSLIPEPDPALVERFDKSIQQRFLSQPDLFGGARIQPPNPPSPHVASFQPINDEEKASLADFTTGGWKVSLHLFGRRAWQRYQSGKKLNAFDINYRMPPPVPITANIQQKNLPSSDKLLKEVRNAFYLFQGSPNKDDRDYKFEMDKWVYFARPVRAVKESCVTCHNDYVVTQKLKDGKFKLRQRRIGDVNGIVVYGFSKVD